jgi:hypothetical protein
VLGTKYFVRQHLIYILIADECKFNRDCPLDKACVSEECVDPCIGTQCGRNAQCNVDYHRAKCSCSRGLQGNPYVSCVPVGCKRDSDCQDTERCEQRSQKCVQLCTGQPCADGAICYAKNHRESCSCQLPLKGDGFAYCTKRKDNNFSIAYYFNNKSVTFIAETPDEPECRVDLDCPTKMSCIQEQCEHPCVASNPCRGIQECSISVSFSGRPLVACSCPINHVSSANGGCDPGTHFCLWPDSKAVAKGLERHIRPLPPTPTLLNFLKNPITNNMNVTN